MTRAEFARNYRAELQEVRDLQARGVDTTSLERNIAGAVREFRSGQPVRDVFDRSPRPELRLPRG